MQSVLYEEFSLKFPLVMFFREHGIGPQIGFFSTDKNGNKPNL